jgi:fermentation-respiration switch protein FrsA (DUF1100 family)
VNASSENVERNSFRSSEERNEFRSTGPKSWRRRLFRLARLAACVYLGVLIVLLALENKLVYHPTRASEDWAPPPAPEVQDVELTSADGTAIHAWWWPNPVAQGAVFYCHGNAGNLSNRGPILARIRQALGESVLIFDYPGYGKSGGDVGEQGCYGAADAAYDWLVQDRGIDPERIIIWGGSLGGGIAVDLASRKKHRALVLAKTFTSAPDVARNIYPWLPVRWLMRNRFDNLGKIDKCRGPVFMAHGTADRLIPFALGKRLFDAANEPKELFAVEGGDHNDPLPAEFFQRLHDFLAENAARHVARAEHAAN